MAQVIDANAASVVDALARLIVDYDDDPAVLGTAQQTLSAARQTATAVKSNTKKKRNLWSWFASFWR